MDKLVVQAGRHVWLGQMVPGTPVASPCAGAEFSLLLADFSGALRGEEQLAVARALIKEGCRWAVCYGQGAAEWETSFDQADLEANPDCDAKRLVMTTSHGTDPLDEIAWFFIWNTSSPGFRPSRFLALTVGAAAEHVRAMQARLSKALADNAQTP
jgi:hypothetical protein